MLAFVRFFFIAFLFATVLYIALWFSFRMRRRRLILMDWKTDHSDRKLKTFLAEETARYDRIRHLSLIAVLYVLPFVTVTVIIYLTNFH
ncbi:hypothetical protein J4E08_05195 [Sagittula sp. NFXS13]|nr:hypothetical protein [Sagittula marina]